MFRLLTETFRRPILPLASAAAFALAPKCAFCVLAYAGIGTALGLSGPEICGAAPQGMAISPLVRSGVALVMAGTLSLRWWRGRLRNGRGCP